MSISGRALLVAAVFGLLLAGPAYAHADYLRSAPGENGVIASPPARVDIWFTQELFRREGANTMMVFGPGERQVHAGEAQVDDDDRTHLWVELLADLEPGTYRVEWRSLSAEDGDNEEGAFSFTFDPQAEQTSTPMGAEAPRL
jgi:methionine-rich copper-binding protein CopC